MSDDLPQIQEAPGARQAEWARWSVLAPEDLLPTICVPDVEMVRGRSGAQANAKTPSFIRPDGRGSGVVAWPMHRATSHDILAWSEDPRHGICLITRALRAIDVDTEEPRVLEFLQARHPDMPLRWRRDSGRVALLYRMASEIAVRKNVVTTEQGAIEFLFDRQQLMVAGRHPDGERYRWARLPRKVEAIPELAREDVVELFRALVTEFGVTEHDDWSDAPGELAGPRHRNQRDPNDPIVAYLFEKGLVLEDRDDGSLCVKSPWADQHTTESGPSSTVFYPAGVGGREEPGYSGLHATDADKTVEDFLTAIGYRQRQVEEEFRDEGVKTPTDRPRFSYKGNSPIIRPVMPNVLRALEWKDTGYFIAYDEFLGTTVFRRPKQKWRDLRDEDYGEIRMHLIDKMRFEDSLAHKPVVEAVDIVAKRHAFDSARRWIEALRWDGKPRVDEFAETVLKLDPSPYHTAVSRYLWTALAGRVMEPGCKADMILVLSGPKGFRKSTLVERIAPSSGQFVAVTLDQRDADLSRALRGKLIVEWPELRGMRSREASSIKAWITQRVDEWIPKYKEFGVHHPRRFILIGTTNEAKYLTDPGGSRRYLPLSVVRRIDTDLMRRWRDQLWAEGLRLWREGGIAWEEAERLAGPAQSAATETHPWAFVLRLWLGARKPEKEGFSPRELLGDAIGMPQTAMTRQKLAELRLAMLGIGWVEDESGYWHQGFL